MGGLAAGGLGAAIKYSPKRQVDPFAAATTEDPDDAMPDDEPLPAWAGGSAAGGAERAVRRGGGRFGGGAEGRTPVGDEVLNLLYRGGLEPTAFSGRLCEWMDGEVMARRDAGRGAGVGPAGGVRRRRVPGRHGISIEDSPGAI